MVKHFVRMKNCNQFSNAVQLSVHIFGLSENNLGLCILHSPQLATDDFGQLKGILILGRFFNAGI